MMTKTSIALALFAPLLTSTAQPQASRAQDLGPAWTPPTNVYGAPVQTSKGLPIDYSEAQLDAQKASWRSSGGHIPQPPLGGCEETGALATWKWFDIGTGIGSAGLAVSQSSYGTELIVSAGGHSFDGARFWQIYRQDPNTGAYHQHFTSPIYVGSSEFYGGLRQLLSGDFDDDGFNEVIAIQDGQVEVWDLNTRQLERAFPVEAQSTGAKLVDIDQNGTLDLMVATENSLGIYDSSGTRFWNQAMGTEDIAVGQMDSDSSLEIALNSGHVIDFDSATTQWFWSNGFSGSLECGDTDNDGIEELIAIPFSGQVWAYDVDTQLPKWSLFASSRGATDLVDLDQDGQLELIVGKSQRNGVEIFDANTRASEGTIHNPEHGITDIIAADPDNDGTLELIWGAGHTSSGRDALFIVDGSSQAIEWESMDLDGPFRAPMLGDVTGDGIDEIVTVCNESDSGYASGRILVFDSQTFALIAVSQEVSESRSSRGTHEVLLAQLDSDPALEIVIATSRHGSSMVEVYDFDGQQTFTRSWVSPPSVYSSDGAIIDLTVADLEGDGSQEIIGAAQWGATYIYSAEAELLEWLLPIHFYGGSQELEVGNTDSDPALEILVIGADGRVYIFDGITRELEALLLADDYTTLTLVDPGLGPHILKVGTAVGDLVTFRHDGSEYSELARVHLDNHPIEQLVIRNGQVAFVGLDGALRMFGATSGEEIWSSCRDYGNEFGAGVGFGPNYAVTAGLYGLVLFGRHR